MNAIYFVKINNGMPYYFDCHWLYSGVSKEHAIQKTNKNVYTLVYKTTTRKRGAIVE